MGIEAPVSLYFVFHPLYLQILFPFIYSLNPLYL